MTASTLPAWTDLSSWLRMPALPDEESPEQFLRGAEAAGVATAIVLIERQPVIDQTTMKAALSSLQSTTVRAIPAVAAVTGGELSDVTSALRTLPTSMPRVLWNNADTPLLTMRVFELAQAHKALVWSQSLDASLSRGASLFEGGVATRMGLPAMPHAAEAIRTAMLIEFARRTPVRLHIDGVSSARGVELIANAQRAGQRVTGAVDIASLLHDEDELLSPHDDRYLPASLPRVVWPTKSDRVALIDAVQAGVLVIASGHRHVPKRERDLEFTRATGGGVQHATCFTRAIEAVGLNIATAALSTSPARILEKL
jgi:dihydroorotase